MGSDCLTTSLNLFGGRPGDGCKIGKNNVITRNSSANFSLIGTIPHGHIHRRIYENWSVPHGMQRFITEGY
jgi:hypothetical protein